MEIFQGFGGDGVLFLGSKGAQTPLGPHLLALHLMLDCMSF